MSEDNTGGQFEDIKKDKKEKFTADQAVKEMVKNEEDFDPLKKRNFGMKISDREDKYHERKKMRVFSPERYDPFNVQAKVNENSRNYIV